MVLWGSLVGGVVVGWLVMVEATEVDGKYFFFFSSFFFCGHFLILLS